MQLETLIEKALALGQAFALGATLVLPTATFASTTTTSPVPMSADFDTPSLSGAFIEKDYSADIQRVMKEIGIARSLLTVIAEDGDAASLTYLDHLESILNAAMEISPDKLPEYSQSLADQLHSMRAELISSVERPKTWLTLSNLVNPGAKLILPERFILTRRQAMPLEVSMPDLQAAVYVRSIPGLRTV
ncbi:MAG: hypothetical protein Tsb0020_21240 [Haliangiales bacterium]